MGSMRVRVAPHPPHFASLSHSPQSPQARLTIDVGSAEAVKRDYGPITVQFVLPGKPSASGLDVRYMKIQKNEKNYNPARWFRVVTVAGSYQVRPHWL